MSNLTEKGRELPVFLKRHSRMFSIVGGLVVLTTFIVKERLQEGWTKQADAIRAARYQYLEHELSAESLAEVRNLRNDVNLLRNQEMCKDLDLQDPPTAGAVHQRDFIFGQTHRLELSRYRILDTYDHLANLRLLAPTLPKEDQDELAKVAQVFPKDPSMGLQTTSFCKADDDLYQWILADYRQQGANLFKLEDLLLKTLDPMREKLPKEADDIIEANERKARFAAWISGILYAVGWALGLADKLVGVEPIAMDE